MEENTLISFTLFLGLIHISCFLPVYKHMLLMAHWAKVLLRAEPVKSDSTPQFDMVEGENSRLPQVAHPHTMSVMTEALKHVSF